jgi:arylformamidase
MPLPPGIAGCAPIDASVAIRAGMPIYEGDPGVAVTRAKAIERGDTANVSRIDIGAHTGTHVDAPRHFVPTGAAVDELPVDHFIGPCAVADATMASTQIDARLVDALDLPPGCRRVLLKTSNSALWRRDAFTPDFVRLNVGGAQRLAEHGVHAVGIDYLSIGDRAVHLALLGRGIGVIEGLDLSGVEPGPYFLVCAPIKIAGCDGAPARALLWRLPEAPQRMAGWNRG